MSSRKKQDEKNLKVIRDLACLQHNKHCFDCNQRGPTYVNTTIGSFVCTKCSGLLRGLTPPHRVKSISMATFTQEEVDLLQSKGNDHCKRTWLGLYEGSLPSEYRDEQTVLEFMIDKYERKRYYLDVKETVTSRNGERRAREQTKPSQNPSAPVYSLPLRINGAANNSEIKRSKPAEFVADFLSADIYNPGVGNVNNNGGPTQASFANFDNNPAFNSNDMFCETFTNTTFNQLPLFPSFNSFDQYISAKTMTNKTQPSVTAPSEDRYAALKDLDNALKSQQTLDWSSGSNGSPYSVSSPSSSSVYSSPSPQGFMPSSQVLISNAEDKSKPMNPFGNGSIIWGSNGSHNSATSNGNVVNPFSPTEVGTGAGFNKNYNWPQNPFKMGTESSGHSYNPFL